MREIAGPRSWIFWWAALTATVFLQDWLPQLANFFRTSGLFTPTSFPFSIVTSINGWIDGIAENIVKAVQFNPNQPIITSPITVQNWVLALIFGIIILAGAVALYVRALSSASLIDDIITLFALYFILRIEAHIVSIAKFSALNPVAQGVLSSRQLTFWVLILLLLVLVILGEGIHSRRAFWRGLFEAILLAMFLLPQETANAIAWFIDQLSNFGNLLQTNLVFGLLWGLVGMLMALAWLTRSDARAA